MRVCTRVRRGLPFAPHAPLCIIRNEERKDDGGSGRKAAYAEGPVGGAEEGDR